MERKKPTNLSVPLVSKGDSERRTNRIYQETFGRRHSTGDRRGSDTVNFINFGEDILMEKFSISDWNDGERSICKEKRKDGLRFMVFSTFV